MAQKKKHRHRSIMGRSDIPYAQRLKMQQQSNIAACRGHSARVALYINSVALHQVEGIGYQRLVRYSFHYKELEDEFYECSCCDEDEEDDEEEEDEDEEDDEYYEDPVYYAVKCPGCDLTLTVGDSVLDLRTFECPACGEIIDFGVVEMEEVELDD